VDGEKSLLDIEIGERIRARRKRRRLSQEVLAGRLGLSQTKISDTENGTVVVQFTPAQWIQLCEELGLSHPNELLGHENQYTRIGDIAAVANDLSDSDIEALEVVARQLASLRRQAEALDLTNIPGWDGLPADFKKAAIEATQITHRSASLHGSAGTESRQRGSATGGRDGRPGARRSPGA